MNPTLSKSLQEAIGRQLSPTDFDLLDLVPLPTAGDKMVRLRTLEEMLDDSEGPSVGYLLKLKPKPTQALGTSEGPTGLESSDRRPQLEGIYLPNGKLNVGYLTRNADLLFDSGDYALARNIYRTILQAGEHPGPAHLRIGRCLEAEGKKDEALRSYTEAVTYHPTAEGYRRMGALFDQLGRPLNAAEAFERATQLKELSKEQRATLHRQAAESYVRAQRTAEAESHYRRVLELQPAASEIRTALGDLHLSNKKNSEAKRCFQDALASNPRSAAALFGLGMISLQEGALKEAHDSFAQSLDIELLQPKAIFHLVKSAYELKTYAAAARILANYCDVAPINANLLYSLAGLQFHMGRLDEAQRTVERVLQISPTHSASLELQKLVKKLAKAEP